MDISYFNHVTQIAQSRWERRRLLVKWWRMYADDPGWVPPYCPLLRRELEPGHNPHLARMAPTFFYTEALPRRRTAIRRDPWLVSDLSAIGLLYERPVVATVALCDPRRQDGTAYLALLRCVNHVESLEHALDDLAETLWAKGRRRMIGPVGLSPYLETGVLEDYWNQVPPLHTSYNPPYLPEIIDCLLQPLSSGRLYHLEIPPELPPSPPVRAQLTPLDPARLATDFLPLMEAACSIWTDFPPPDAEEVKFLLRWVGCWPLYGWLAQVDGQPAGFVLMQPDVAPMLRRANGGRNPLWWLWLAWRGRRPVCQGRVLYGAVSPQWTGQGIGRQLLHQVLVVGCQQGWRSVSIGPVPDGASATYAFLERHGAQPCQTYRLYQRDL